MRKGLLVLCLFLIVSTAVGQVASIPDPNLRTAIEQQLHKAAGATITVADMKRLTVLYGSNISDLTGLQHATNLTEAYLGNTSKAFRSGISDLKPLAGLKKLTTLSLVFASISNITPLAGLTNLTDLRLSKNRISNITPLAGLTNLTDLGLSENRISNITPLDRLTNLTRLGLKNNTISDLSPLLANTGLGRGDWVNVRWNPLNPQSSYTHIPALLRRGVIVNFTVNIPDRNLRVAILRELDKSSGSSISSEEIVTLSELSRWGANIRDLTGLQYATNLTKLSLRRNSVSDLSPLADLTNLKQLFLENNSISDIKPLAGLTKLTSLNLSENRISDIKPLAGLLNLTDLNLSNTAISDIKPLDRLTNLRGLWLGGNSISDIKPLAGLLNLTDLNLSNTAISDIKPLIDNTGLGRRDRVNIRENPLNIQSHETHIPTLQSRGLTVEFDPPRPVYFPDPPLRAAVESALGKAAGAEITIVDMAKLTRLVAPNANISYLGGLKDAINLRFLSLGRGTVSDLSPLANLTKLQDLFISYNNISDVSPLSGLTQLRRLILGGTPIADLSPLTGLTQLTTLKLWSSSLTDISFLVGLTQISSLELSGNAISDVAPLANFTKLTWLSLRNNRITDLSPLVSNTGLGSGDRVDVKKNPLSDQSHHTHIPALQRRGVIVEFDPLPPVYIPDPNLRAKIRQALGKGTSATITEADMAKLTQLGVQGLNIRNLSGLERATNLTDLYLGTNAISDLMPLEDLTNLTTLTLTNNSISNLSPLSGLTNLTSLWLNGNSISNIKPLENLTNLIELKLGGNAISNLSPLARLTNLKELRLYNNSVSDLKPLVDNTGLGSGDFVDVRQNPLSLQSYQTHIPALQRRGVTVQFDPPRPVNIPDRNLRAVIANRLGKSAGATITTVDMLELTRLDAQNANISDLTGLEAAINLQHLNLGGAFVAGTGYVNSNSVSDLSPLAELTQLTTLDLHKNSIVSISALSRLTNLTDLYLNDNRITNISSLSDLIQLKNLGLEHNTITNISALARLTRLEWLLLKDNRIKNISAVSGLRNLIFLDMDQNLVTDLSPLVSNTGLGRGNEVTVRGNPLSRASHNTHIPTLQSRGVVVRVDPAVIISDPNLRAAIENALGKAAGATIMPTDMAGLTELIVRDANISDLTGLEAATHLIRLNLRDNRISNLSPLSGLTHLTTLNLRGNAVSYLLPLSGLTGLTWLGLRDNQITDLSSLVSNTGFGPGDTIDVRGNALSATSLNTHIPVLQGRGVVVRFGDAAAPSIVRDTTPVLEVSGLIVDPTMGLNTGRFRVIVKNLSTDGVISAVTAPDAAAYRLTFVDTETGRAAGVGDILEISARAPDPLIGVEPLRYTVTAEDVLWGHIQLEGLVVYEIPAETELLANYPNPFNPETWIPYRLAEDADVSLTIYDQNGQIVRTLDVGFRRAAVYERQDKAIYWDGRNNLGEAVASGVYFYHLSAGDYSATRKMLIVK